MSVAIFKQKIRSKLIKNAVIITVLSGLAIGAYSYSSSKERAFQDLQSKISSITGQISSKKNEYEESQANLKEYLSIDKLKLPSKIGYDVGRERLKVLSPRLEEMRDIYLFKKLVFTLSEVKESKNINSNIFSAYDNYVSIEFEGVSDEYIYSFINDLKNVLPGYLNIRSISLTKSQDITIASAVDYISATGKPFVTGKMELEWVTLKSKQNDDNRIEDIRKKGR